MIDEMDAGLKRKNLSTPQIILHLVCHKPTKWDSDNHTLL